MDKKEAIDFLTQNQPLPDDNLLTQDLIDQYDMVMRYFHKHPNKESLRLFFNSFGNGDGFGVYPLVEDTIMAHNYEDVVPELENVLINGIDSCIYWYVQIAANYPDEKLIAGLSRTIANDNPDIREASVIALESIGGAKAKHILYERILKEEDEKIVNIVKDVLS